MITYKKAQTEKVILHTTLQMNIEDGLIFPEHYSIHKPSHSLLAMRIYEKPRRDY